MCLGGRIIVNIYNLLRFSKKNCINYIIVYFGMWRISDYNIRMIMLVDKFLSEDIFYVIGIK